LVVTHNPRHAAWADRVLFLRDGEVIERAVFAEAPADAPHPDASRLPLAGLGARQGTDLS
jgi:putative ABC transport system ATP-binding protein